MKKIVFTVIMLFAIVGFTQAQTSTAKANTQRKESIKPANSVNTVSSTTKKSTNNTKTNSGQKPGLVNIGKHKKSHQKAKKTAKKS